MKACPLCGKENDDDWPIEVNGEIKDGGCQDCWEAQCDAEWWKMVITIDRIMAEKKTSARDIIV